MKSVEDSKMGLPYEYFKEATYIKLKFRRRFKSKKHRAKILCLGKPMPPRLFNLIKPISSSQMHNNHLLIPSPQEMLSTKRITKITMSKSGNHGFAVSWPYNTCYVFGTCNTANNNMEQETIELQKQQSNKSDTLEDSLLGSLRFSESGTLGNRNIKQKTINLHGKNNNQTDEIKEDENNNNNNNKIVQNDSKEFNNENANVLGMGRNNVDSTMPFHLNCFNKTKIVEIGCSNYHGLALNEFGIYYAWGNQILTGLFNDTNTPTQLDFTLDLG